MDQYIGIFISIFIILLGIYFLKVYSEYGSKQGINTLMARKSKENWDYAQKNAPIVMIRYGSLNILVNFLILLYSSWRNHFASRIVGIIEIAISLSIVIIMMVHTEMDIRKFEKYS